MLDLEKFRKALTNMTQEDIDKFKPNPVPKGWVSIEAHLPMWMALDVVQGYSSYKVRYADGSEGMTKVSDHSTWYYLAKEKGITHWFNE